MNWLPLANLNKFKDCGGELPRDRKQEFKEVTLKKKIRNNVTPCAPARDCGGELPRDW